MIFIDSGDFILKKYNMVLTFKLTKNRIFFYVSK